MEEDGAVTLFIKNIGFETTQDKFKEFMQKFGELKYAVLCKSETGHKGTGFVRFKDNDIAK